MRLHIKTTSEVRNKKLKQNQKYYQKYKNEVRYSLMSAIQ